LARNLYEVSVEAVAKSPLGKISVSDLLARSPQICICNVSVQDPYIGCLLASSLYKLLIRGVLARSVSEISAQALYKSSFGKILVRDL
jgi:hypothetical protein